MRDESLERRLARIEAVIEPPDCALAEAVLELVQIIKSLVSKTGTGEPK